MVKQGKEKSVEEESKKMRQKIEEGKMAKQVAHQETTNSINDGHWRRKITKNC